MSVTLLIILITVLVSIAGFQNSQIIHQALFYPSVMDSRKEYWRFFTHGFIHADWSHLIFNMLTLYFFGKNCESAFEYLYGNTWMFPLFYLAALLMSSLPSYAKHKNNYSYRALGASGAVASVLFYTILLNPWQLLMIQFIIPIPAILFGVGYIAYSSYQSKNGSGDGIGHEAHLWGAVFGLVFPLATKPEIFPYFINQLLHPSF
ncbi:MAG: rhomboid family intramembrane serine protease [Chitinophagaceae bacterium]